MSDGCIEVDPPFPGSDEHSESIIRFRLNDPDPYVVVLALTETTLEGDS